ncbi:hypothetical protein [Nocardiopsis tropica]|uniref:Uncharacterized protein n=1 Tax=Nocardiopsis tropica TaxID=109330 RepID=A0ABU7KHY7_9ACTN|nr:hypothetical protein [Nocardiopsis umidischolae]MEE2048898.1 hypothetical protein [Nocardiopsis umidischolae]
MLSGVADIRVPLSQWEAGEQGAIAADASRAPVARRQARTGARHLRDGRVFRTSIVSGCSWNG